MTDVCFLQWVIWRGQVARTLGMKIRRYMLWWCGKRYEIDGVGVVVM